MTCNEFQEGLEPSFDNEANSETALEMQAHIEQCLTREGLFSGCLAVRRCQQNPTFVIARQPIFTSDSPGYIKRDSLGQSISLKPA